jgi:hypothetical protein
MDKASALEESLLENYGSINPMDEMGLAITQLFAFACVIFSLISVYKCLVVVFAPSKQTANIYLYPATVILSLITALLAHEKFLNNLVNSSHTLLDLAQPLLVTIRGVIFYKILYTSYNPKSVPIKEGKEGEVMKNQVVIPKQTTFSKLCEITSKTWFFGYWLVYALVGSFYYDEMVKYIIEEHVSVEAIVKFIFV